MELMDYLQEPLYSIPLVMVIVMGISHMFKNETRTSIIYSVIAGVLTYIVTILTKGEYNSTIEEMIPGPPDF